LELYTENINENVRIRPIGKCAARRLAKKHIIALVRYWTNEKCVQKYGRDLQLSANKEIFQLSEISARYYKHSRNN